MSGTAEDAASIYGAAIARLYGSSKPRSRSSPYRGRFGRSRLFGKKSGKTVRPVKKPVRRFYWYDSFMETERKEEALNEKFISPDRRAEDLIYRGVRSSNTFRSGQQGKPGHMKRSTLDSGALQSMGGIIYRDGKQQRSKIGRAHHSPTFCKGDTRAGLRRACILALNEYRNEYYSDLTFEDDLDEISIVHHDASEPDSSMDDGVEIDFDISSEGDFPSI